MENKENRFKIRKENFINKLEEILVSKRELAKEFLKDKGLDKDHSFSNDQKTIEAFYILNDYKTTNDVFGISTLKNLIKLLKSDTRFWSKELRNICNIETKLSFLQIKDDDGYKVLSFILDYCDKSNSWTDINELGKIAFCGYDNRRDVDAFHFLRTVLTNNSFLARYGYYYNRQDNVYVKSKVNIRFEPDIRNRKINGIKSLFNLYIDCIEYKDFQNFPFDFEREFESLFSLYKLSLDNNKELSDMILRFLRRMVKYTGLTSSKYNEEFMNIK